MNLSNAATLFKQIVPSSIDYWTLRLSVDTVESLDVRENILQPPSIKQSCGAHITVVHSGGIAYAATSQLTTAGFTQAIDQALRWLEITKQHSLVRAEDYPRPKKSGSYQTPVVEAWNNSTANDKISLLHAINKDLNISDAIVDYQATLSRRETESLIVSSDDIHIEQQFHFIVPGFYAVANKGSQTQMRTGGGWSSARQGGLEQLASFNFPTSAQQTAEEALALVDAAECPTGKMSLLLLPSQMMLQIHESIGHPLELDRILGDERNYAGTSFVTEDMFGHYQYGSELLNVSSNASIPEEMASFAFDDEGTPAEKTYLIRHGKLERPLGGASSQTRTHLPGVANARACDWNRPAMDRMANLNVEPGDKSLEQLISSIENGVLMDTNKSWSIDDSRNKFQFGCEFGRVIRNGELKEIVRNPNYRGISANFWRNLTSVGNDSTFEVWGTPYCGKGEPNQMIHVGHASPACVFSNIEIFGGA